MAEPLDSTELAALDAKLHDALGAVGSTLTFEAAAPPVARVDADPAPTATVVALDEPEPPALVVTQMEPIADAPPAVMTAPAPSTGVSREELAAWREEQQAQTRELVQAIVQAQRPALVMEPATTTTTPVPTSLADAVMQAYLSGDKTPVEAWEQAQQATTRQAQAQHALQVFQQQKIHDLSTAYPFLGKDDTWKETLAEVAKLKASPALAGLLPDDPRQQVQHEGQALDLRLLAMAAHAMQARMASTDAATTAATTAQADATRQAAPGVQGATPLAPRAKTPQLVLPANMVQGEDALLNDPRVQKALADIKWGTDPRTQQKRVAERLSPRMKQDLQRQYRQGQRVGTA